MARTNCVVEWHPFDQRPAIDGGRDASPSLKCPFERFLVLVADRRGHSLEGQVVLAEQAKRHSLAHLSNELIEAGTDLCKTTL
jgi:hypothetical protein